MSDLIGREGWAGAKAHTSRFGCDPTGTCSLDDQESLRVDQRPSA
jgi:hypothetical protein